MTDLEQKMETMDASIEAVAALLGMSEAEPLDTVTDQPEVAPEMKTETEQPELAEETTDSKQGRTE